MATGAGTSSAVGPGDWDSQRGAPLGSLSTRESDSTSFRLLHNALTATRIGLHLQLPIAELS